MNSEKNIFPAEIIENSVEKHFQEYNPGSRIVYLSVLGIVVVAFILLFIIRVDVTVRSAGTIRSVQERTDIRAPINGVVDSVFISENQHVRAGDPLIKIKGQAIEDKNIAVENQYTEVKAQLADLKALLAGDDGALQSSLYLQQNATYKQRISDAQLAQNLASQNYNRYSQLYRSRAISAAEFDKYSFESQNAAAQLKLIREQQRSQWQGDLTRLEQQNKEIEAQRSAYQEQRDLNTIRANVSGTVQKLKTIAPGTFVNPAEMLGEISPDSGLIAEAYVNTKDVGMLQLGAPVRMQVDAFNPNIWGSLKGKIASISEDVFMEGGTPYYKVRCVLEKTVMKLRNGYEGSLKKGMTVQARFIVTRRSLFQLMHETTSDWFSPATKKKTPQHEVVAN